MNAPVITLTGSHLHLNMAIHAMRRATSRAERLAAAEKHKPYMLASDVQLLRAAYKTLPPLGEPQ